MNLNHTSKWNQCKEEPNYPVVFAIVGVAVGWGVQGGFSSCIVTPRSASREQFMIWFVNYYPPL